MRTDLDRLPSEQAQENGASVMTQSNPCGCGVCNVCGIYWAANGIVEKRPPPPAVWIDPHAPPVKGERKKKPADEPTRQSLFDSTDDE